MKTYLYGCGGHAKVVLDILKKQQQSVTAFVDDNPAIQTKQIHGIPVHLASEFLSTIAEQSQWIICIGNNQTRQRIAEKLNHQGHLFTTAIHPSAQIALGVKIAPGTVVMANAVINTDTQIGHHVIINTGVTVDHDCQIDDYCHIAPGSALCGQVHVKKSVFLGAGSTVCPSLEIGEYTTCGAGSVVIQCLPSHVLAYGCPAKIRQTNFST
ncbi:acetyltransferase [Spirulina major CS-329]|uniref:acetyltransferase n=1 Tax=Spirulina TaxID=1154 RepID=UPI00232EE844|nr:MULTISPECIES: acetyltransferase [Spirulina]MDB9494347.1 acetyltransferase [Spirulina subsalsa CS-330]MDB9502337.1 acetyltransferase [Spirulina major CS-329]